MADEKNNGETPDLDQRDINNPRDRDALKRAADDFLKARKAEAVSEVAEDEALDDDAVNPMVELQVANNALKDQVLRIAADMENLRKRTAREIQDAKTYATTNFARDMLAVSALLCANCPVDQQLTQPLRQQGFAARIEHHPAPGIGHWR